MAFVAHGAEGDVGATGATGATDRQEKEQEEEVKPNAYQTVTSDPSQAFRRHLRFKTHNVTPGKVLAARRKENTIRMRAKKEAEQSGTKKKKLIASPAFCLVFEKLIGAFYDIFFLCFINCGLLSIGFIQFYMFLSHL